MSGQHPVRMHISVHVYMHGEVGKGMWGWVGSNPSSVRMQLMKKSAPQPATRRTPRGGTVGAGRSISVVLLVVFQRATHGRW
jgi:hypothetical protein